MPRSSPISAVPPGQPLVGDGPGLARLSHLLRRSWRWIVLPTMAAGLGAIAYVQVATPQYTGAAKLHFANREAAFTRTTRERGEEGAPTDEQALAGQVQAVMSRDLAREAIRRLKLVGNPEFDPAVAGIGPVQRLLMMIGVSANPLERTPEDRTLEAYFDRLLVGLEGTSRILSVEFSAKDPDLAAQAANTVAELYLASLEAAKTDTARQAPPSPDGAIETLRVRVAEAEAKVEAYRARNGLIGDGAATQSPGARRLGELSTQLSQARAVKADLTERAKSIKEMIKDNRVVEIRDVANNETIRRIVEQRITLRGQLALQSRTLLPAHPRIKELTAQVADLDKQIKAIAERVVRTMENDARIAETRLESLGSAVDAQRDVVSKGSSSEVQLRALEREAAVQREQLESELSRHREASIQGAEGATLADARIVSRALAPEMPSFPRKLPIVTLAMVMALLLSTGGVVARHRLTNRSDLRRRRGSEVSEAGTDARAPAPLRLAYLDASATTPSQDATAMVRLEPKATLTLLAPPGASVPPIASVPGQFALDGLLTRLSEHAPAGAGRRILFLETRDFGLDGHSETLADTLADALAQCARTVTLDLNGPACGSQDFGLTDLVAGEAAFLDVIQRVPGSRLDTVQRGSLAVDVLVEKPEALEIAVDALAQAYDWVLCRLCEADDAATQALLAAVSGTMDAVVIASNRDADDAELVHLYTLAETSGAGRILVATDRIVAEEPEQDFGSHFALRRSAA